MLKGNYGALASVNCWGKMKLRPKLGVMISSHCLLPVMSVINVVLAVIDGLIAMVAFIQLLRIQLRNPHVGWTRQKVFYFMIGTSNIGYFIYFTLTSIAYCKEWICWSHACGFIVISLPQILFLSAFLLLLSFWYVCYQASFARRQGWVFPFFNFMFIKSIGMFRLCDIMRADSLIQLQLLMDEHHGKNIAVLFLFLGI